MCCKSRPLRSTYMTCTCNSPSLPFPSQTHPSPHCPTATRPAAATSPTFSVSPNPTFRKKKNKKRKKNRSEPERLAILYERDEVLEGLVCCESERGLGSFIDSAGLFCREVRIQIEIGMRELGPHSSTFHKRERARERPRLRTTFRTGATALWSVSKNASFLNTGASYGASSSA